MPVYVSVAEKPDVSLLVSNPEFCQGLCSEIQLIVLPNLNDTIKNYTFTNSKSESYLINTINSICPNQSGSYNFTIHLETQKGCILDSVYYNAIQVYPSPVSAFSVNPDSAFITHPVFTFYNLSENANYYEWNFGDNSQLVINQINPIHTYGDTGVYEITLLVKNEFGCADTSFKIIKVKDEFAIYIPNAFTPNGDFDNPTFGAKGVGITDFEMFVYNRWGELIFTSENINTQWDGTYKGLESPPGVYVYIINVKSISGKTYNFTGHFTLIR
jgi:gliding motility-associated-like protein